MPDFTIVKGDWIRAEWLEATDSSLSGKTLQFSTRMRSVSGIVCIIKADPPVRPKTVRLLVKPDSGEGEVLVDPAWVKEISKRPPLSENPGGSVSLRWPAGRPLPSEEHAGCTSFTVRLYDMFDGWIDIGTNLSEQQAMRLWLEKTSGGRKNISYSEGDYYRIFPADTAMIFTPEALGR